MSNHTPVSLENVAEKTLVKPGVPVYGTALGEQSIWKRYSPHHEFPLSVLATFVMYFFAVLMVLVLGGLVLNLWAGATIMDLEPIMFAGGGGDPNGSKNSHVNNGPQEALDFPIADAASDQPVITTTPDLTTTNAPDRVVEQSQTTKFKTENSRGRGGLGVDGGKGPGRGPGDGPGDGPGKQSWREKRKDRWVVNFPFNSSEDYLRRLADLGAYVAFPEADQKYRMYDDLTRKNSRLGTIDDIKKWNRIYWRDSNLDSRDAIAAALGMSTLPPYFWIFLPVELEAELFAKEKAFRDLSEDEIIRRNLETTFAVERVGGKFSVKVLRQERRGAGK